MKKGLETKTMLLISAFSLVLGGAAVFVQYGSRAEAYSQKAAVESEVPDGKKLMGELREAKSQLAVRTAKLQHLEKDIPNVAYIPTMLRELEQVGLQSSLEVTGVRPVPPRPSSVGDSRPQSNRWEEVYIDVRGRGDFAAAMDLVDRLKSFPKVVELETISLKPKYKEVSPNYEYIDTVFRIKAFVFPEDGQQDQRRASRSVAALTKNNGETS
jgi:Tfp pilus assembly protein PilO